MVFQTCLSLAFYVASILSRSVSVAERVMGVLLSDRAVVYLPGDDFKTMENIWLHHQYSHTWIKVTHDYPVRLIESFQRG